MAGLDDQIAEVLKRHAPAGERCLCGQPGTPDGDAHVAHQGVMVATLFTEVRRPESWLPTDPPRFVEGGPDDGAQITKLFRVPARRWVSGWELELPEGAPESWREWSDYAPY